MGARLSSRPSLSIRFCRGNRRTYHCTRKTFYSFRAAHPRRWRREQWKPPSKRELVLRFSGGNSGGTVMGSIRRPQYSESTSTALRPLASNHSSVYDENRYSEFVLEPPSGSIFQPFPFFRPRPLLLVPIDP